MIVYEIATYGGQIIDGRAPRPIEVNGKFAEYLKAQFARYGGFAWDNTANYYETYERAKNAANWALCN